MPRPLIAQFEAARRLVFSADPWLAFVQIGRSMGGAYRLVRSAEPRLARVPASGDSTLWYWQAASIDIELPGSNADGALPRLTVSIPNVSRLPGALVEIDVVSTGGAAGLEQGQILGQSVTVWLAPVLRQSASPVVLDPAASFAAIATAAIVTPRSVSIECAHPSVRQRIPRGVYDRTTTPALQGL